VSGDPILVRIDADWNTSDLLRQTPHGAGLWNGIRFTTEAAGECDLMVMVNHRKLETVRTRCAPGNVWAIMQEPYVPQLYDWLTEGHECYARVFTHVIPSDHPRYVRSQPAVPWGTNLSYDELRAAAQPAKSRGASWISSNLSFLPEHRYRCRLQRYLREREPGLVDVCGRGIRWIPRKWDALAPYRFSLAIENSVGPDLWTEKVADCFLSWTVPIYRGCTNLEQYFPEGSFVRLESDDPADVCRTIRSLLASDEWERRLPAVEEARELVLTHYQIFPYLAHLISEYGLDAGPKRDIVIPGYRWRRWRHRARYIGSKLRHGEFGDLVNAAVNKATYLRRT
jgi:hypothetical protein